VEEGEHKCGAGGECGAPRLGIGMDASVTPIPDMPDTALAQTTDFFYPLVDDPYMQGRIACANVLSDLYAMGVVRCHNMLMLLAVSRQMTDQQRDVVIPLIMRGFQDTAREAGCLVTGGQTVLNPWVLVGGVASSVCRTQEIIMPDGAQPGQVLVLTKPLGTQLAVNAHQWLQEKGEKWDKISGQVTEAEVVSLYRAATLSMARLNLTAARLMHKYGATAATDVTGFGLLGHARNLAAAQTAGVELTITRLPLLRGAAALARGAGAAFQLVQGFSAETSGGLLLSLGEAAAAEFCAEIEQLEPGCPAWVVGRVGAGRGSASIVQDPVILEV